jgi:phosphatidylglycerophosphate synthase
MPDSPATVAPTAWILESPKTGDVRIWGLTPGERQRRLLERAGCRSIRVLQPDDEVPDPGRGGSLVIARADAILDERLIEGLMAAENTVLSVPQRRLDSSSQSERWGGAVAAHVDVARAEETRKLLRAGASGQTPPPPAGVRLAATNDLASDYTVKLRKFDPPYVYPAVSENVRAVEDRVFDASYKGVTDLITKWLWPRPAAAVVRILAAAGVRPNTVTAVSWLLTIAAFALFLYGWFGLGLLCAWGMTFLDTVDGKLARVTLTSSRIGHVLDHGLDNVHPPFWWFAWGVGLSATGWQGAIEPITGIVVIGYLVGRGLEATFILKFGIETHCWRPIDSLFRTITARRNPNLILLTVATIGGRPDLGLVMVAIWTLVSTVFHVERVVQALFERSRGTPIRRWDETPVDEREIELVRDEPGRAA